MIVIVEELLVLCAQGIAVDSPPHFLAVRGLEANSPTLPVYGGRMRPNFILTLKMKA
jgi:hypothetical protein